jgi:hypothetical protein
MLHGPKSVSLSLFRELGSFKDFEGNFSGILSSEQVVGSRGESDEITDSQEKLGGAFREAIFRTGMHHFRGAYAAVANHDDAYNMFLFAQ